MDADHSSGFSGHPEDHGAGPASNVNILNGAVEGLVVQAGSIGTVNHHARPASASAQPLRRIFGTMPPRAGAFQARQAAVELSGATIDGGTTVLTGVGSRVVSGLGGVGKTQLAADHARTLWSRDQLDVLMWVGATSRDAILSAFGRAATAIDGIHAQDAEQAANRWLEWLAATTKRWLVVLDDLQDPADIRGLWPPHTVTGAVVVTTRRRDAALCSDGRRVVEVGLFTKSESRAFLSQRLIARPAQIAGAADLAEELGHLPLALAQAAAYIADRPTLTCASYMARWLDRRRTLPQVLPETGGLPDEHRATVATTWSLSVDLADDLHPAGLARPVLELISLLDANGIPEAVLTAATTLAHLSTRVGRSVDTEAATDALSCLHRLSLATHDPGTPHRAVRVHALVQRAIREALPAAAHAVVAQAAADGLLESWPKNHRDTELASVLRSNTDALRANADTSLWAGHGHPVLFLAGDSLGQAGQVHSAAHYYRSLSAIAEQRLGADHPDTLGARRCQVRWHGKAGDPAGAAAECEEVLADHERVLGPDHPDTLLARRNLAKWKGQAGDPAAAAAALDLVVVDHIRVLGPDHPDTLGTRTLLAQWHGEAGNALGAALEFEQLLTDCARVLGTDHPHTVLAGLMLAMWRGEAGDVTFAVTALTQVSADCERVLGASHPYTLYARATLATWRGTMGDTVGAAEALQQVLADFERVSGADHPYTVVVRNNMTHWLTAAAAKADNTEPTPPLIRRPSQLLPQSSC
ncbi:MAG TPA: tetratricopeptide repeat-containing protein [Lentzea sp.]